MKKRTTLVPEYGPLAGMRIVGTGSLIAMPFAATMMADFGAEVIQIERPGVGDTYRSFPPVVSTEKGSASSSWIQDARNRLSLTLELDLRDPDVKEIFLKLIAESDIYIENMVWLEKLGIRDEELLSVNPRLVIVHISGFGHAEFGGLPEICDQASYDMIGQAFSGYVLYNGYEDRPPIAVKPSLNDYVTGLFAMFGMLIAYISARDTGKGQVVDVAQFEAQARIMRDNFTTSFLGLGEVTRCGTKARSFQPWDMFSSADGRYVAIGAFGKNVYERFLEAVGMDAGQFPYELVSKDRQAVASPLGQMFDRQVVDWCAARTAEEIQDIMRAHRVPCSCVNDAGACLENEQFLSRGDFESYVDQTTGLDVTAFGIVPKLSGTPGRIWRGGPSLGQDTEAILSRILGYDSLSIERFRAKGII